MRGKIVLVDSDFSGTTMAAAAASGATSISIDDVVEFEEDGGYISLNGTKYQYASVTGDDEAGWVMKFATGVALLIAADDDDQVYLWPITREKIAYVDLLNNDDLQICDIEQGLQTELEEGIRDAEDQENVIAEIIEGSWTIVDILTKNPYSELHFDGSDAFSAVALGTQVFILDHVPYEESLIVHWNGVNQPLYEWTLDDKKVTIPDAGGLIQIGDVFNCYYAYKEEAESGTIYPAYSDLVVSLTPTWYMRFENPTLNVDTMGHFTGGPSNYWNSNDVVGLYPSATDPGRARYSLGTQGLYIPMTGSTQGSFTFACAVRDPGGNGDWGILVSQSGAISAARSYALGFLDDGTPLFWANARFQLQGPVSLKDGLVHHMVWTHDRSTHTAKIYADGTEIASVVGAADFNSGSGTWTFNGDNGRHYKGYVDEAAEWEGLCFSAAQVADLYNAWQAGM